MRAAASQEAQIEMAQEMQRCRSEQSQREDPTLPDNLNSAKLVAHQAMFLSTVEKKYIFKYQIHTDAHLGSD